MATENEQLLEEQARLREKEDRKFMRQALTQAKKAAAIDEVPIGCALGIALGSKSDKKD